MVARVVACVGLLACVLAPVLAHGQDAETVYKKALPSVMTLKVKTKDNGTSTGTGFLAIKDGVAVTAWHVVQDAQSVIARFSDGKEFEVSGLIDKDEQRDVALIRVKVADRPLLPLATAAPAVGSKVFVLGAPKGLEFSFTDGIISQIRSDGRATLYQYSAETNPGNSGGPLLNGRGEVLGVISWKLKDTQNVNFAVAATYARGLDSSLPTRTWASLPTTAASSVSPGAPVPNLPPPLEAASSWYSNVGKAFLAWDIWWNKQVDENSRDSLTLAPTNCYRYCGEMRKAILSDPAVVLGVVSPAFEEPLMELSKAIGELAAAYVNCIGRARFGTSEELEAANNEMGNQYKRVRALYSACYRAFKQETWFKWPDFEAKLNPAVLFQNFLPMLEGLFPDPAISDRCMVGFAKGSDLRAGDVIIAVREIPSASYAVDGSTAPSTKVSSWRDLREFLRKSSSTSVEVNVGSENTPRFLKIGVIR